MFTWPWKRKEKEAAAQRADEAGLGEGDATKSVVEDGLGEDRAARDTDTEQALPNEGSPVHKNGAEQGAGALATGAEAGKNVNPAPASASETRAEDASPSPAEASEYSRVHDPYELPDPPEELPGCLGGPIADMAEVAAHYDVAEVIRLFLVFDGTVQGVGFRWTTQALAEKVGVTGWVRNMDDGTVQAEMQGPGHDICRVLAALRGQFIEAWANYEVLRRMKFHFVITCCERMAPREGEDAFNVRF